MERRADPDAGRRIGIFGGSFDPPHVGHVAVAADVARSLELDTLFWVPAGQPPHKRHRTLTDGYLRLKMVRAAVQDHACFQVDDLELRRSGPSYTADTVREIGQRYPSAELFLVLGVDQLLTFAKGWRRPEEILRWATLAAMDRDGSSTLDVPATLPGMERTQHVAVTRVDVSSSQIRARVAAGLRINSLVPSGVAGIISREGLYRD